MSDLSVNQSDEHKLGAWKAAYEIRRKSFIDEVLCAIMSWILIILALLHSVLHISNMFTLGIVFAAVVGLLMAALSATVRQTAEQLMAKIAKTFPETSEIGVLEEVSE